MANKLNCWEYMNCGLEPGGALSAAFGVCPVALAFSHDGENGGRAGGRVCWTLQNLISASPRFPFRQCANGTCTDCRFKRRVAFEEKSEPVRFSIESVAQES